MNVRRMMVVGAAMQEKREEVRFAVRECDELGELYMRFARSDAAAAASPSRTTWSARFYVERSRWNRWEAGRIMENVRR